MSLLAASLAAGSFAAAGWIGWRYLRQRPETTNNQPAVEPEAALRLSGSADNWCKVLPGEVLLQHCHAQLTLDEILRQTRLIHGKTLGQMLAQGAGCPLAKARTLF